MSAQAIEAVVAAFPELRGPKKLILVAIAHGSFDMEPPYLSTYSVPKIMRFTGMSRTQVYAHLQALEKAGAYTVKREPGKPVEYTLMGGPGFRTGPGMQTGPGFREKGSGFPDGGVRVSEKRGPGFRTELNIDMDIELNRELEGVSPQKKNAERRSRAGPPPPPPPPAPAPAALPAGHIWREVKDRMRPQMSDAQYAWLTACRLVADGETYRLECSSSATRDQLDEIWRNRIEDALAKITKTPRPALEISLRPRQPEKAVTA